MQQQLLVGSSHLAIYFHTLRYLHLDMCFTLCMLLRVIQTLWFTPLTYDFTYLISVYKSHTINTLCFTPAICFTLLTRITTLT